MGHRKQLFCLPSRRVWALLAFAILPCSSQLSFAYVPEERWGATATNLPTPMGDPLTLTWSIVPDGTQIQGEGGSDLISFLDGRFGAGPGGTDLTQRPWFAHLSNSFDRWSAVSGLTFVYEPNDDQAAHGTAAGLLGARGDIRIGGAFVDGASGTLAYSYFPNNSDMVIDTGDSAFFGNSTGNFRAFRNTFMHELGHGLGLDHVQSNTNAFLMEPSINISYEGPQLDDIRGIQAYYGDALEKTNGGLGNETAPFASALGLVPSGGTRSIGVDAAHDTVVAATEIDFVSIANSVDVDFFSFEVATPTALNVTLTPWGGVFNQGVQGGTQSQFNANSRNDLALAVYGTDGISLLAQANNVAAGGIESLTGLRLESAGKYFVRVTGSAEQVQFYQLDVTAVAPAVLLAGDFNQNGEVDAADYIVWRHSLGMSGPGLPADANNDLVVDTADQLIWRANFGAVLGSSTSLLAGSIPEPGTALLLLAGLMTWGTLQRGFRDRRSPVIVARLFGIRTRGRQ